MSSVNWDDLLASYEDSGVSLCPVGTHDVRVVAAEYGETTTGRSKFVVQYELIGGPHAGRKVKHWMTIVKEYPGLVAQWFKQMDAMGLPKTYFQAKPTNEQVCADLVGRTCRIEVGRRKKNGSDDETEDISKVLPPLDGAAATAGIPTAFPSAPAVGAADPLAPQPPF